MTGSLGPVPEPGHRTAPPVAPPTPPPASALPPPPWTGAAPRTLVEPEPAPRRSRRPVLVLSLVLVAVLMAAGLVGSRLWSTTQAWQDAAAEWEELARTHGEQLAQSHAELEATTGELEATRAQLATAQTRITELADEKAQLGDTTAAQQQLADYQERVSQAAGQVATALATCVDGQERLIGYLQDAERYDANDIGRFRADVESVCGAASDANTKLQQELSR